jgi:hypothetical protein
MRTDHTTYSVEQIGREVVAFALRAPSVHNTQPWRWRVDGPRLDLYADRTRQLSVVDRAGRDLTISCGAALHYAVAGAAAAGWAGDVTPLPDATDPDHLATVLLRPSDPTRAEQAEADLLRTRATDRRRFIGWPVPAHLLEDVAARGASGSAEALAVTDPAARLSIERLLTTARSIEHADRRMLEEQRRWTSLTGDDGVPLANAQPATSGLRPTWPSRYDAVIDDVDPSLAGPFDGLVLVKTPDDTPASWLDTGRLLCRLWTAAMDRGLSLVPLSQPLEVADTRRSLRVGVLGGDGFPQLLARLGWQEPSRSALPVTPRRSVDDVLADPPG